MGKIDGCFGNLLDSGERAKVTSPGKADEERNNQKWQMHTAGPEQQLAKWSQRAKERPRCLSLVLKNHHSDLYAVVRSQSLASSGRCDICHPVLTFAQFIQFREKDCLCLLSTNQWALCCTEVFLQCAPATLWGGTVRVAGQASVTKTNMLYWKPFAAVPRPTTTTGFLFGKYLPPKPEYGFWWLLCCLKQGGGTKPMLRIMPGPSLTELVLWWMPGT